MKTATLLPLAAALLAAACSTSAGGTFPADASSDAATDASPLPMRDAASPLSDASTVAEAGNPGSDDAGSCTAAVPSTNPTCEACLETNCCPYSVNCEVLTFDGGINGCQAIDTCVNACYDVAQHQDGGSLTVCQAQCEGQYPTAQFAYAHWLTCQTGCSGSGC